MSKTERRGFSLAFKLNALARLEAGETVMGLAAEFGVHRQLIYKWRDADRAGRLGTPRGRPPKGRALAREREAVEALGELEWARRRIAELERKVGQQVVELDFFQGALRRIKAPRPRGE